MNTKTLYRTPNDDKGRGAKEEILLQDIDGEFWLEAVDNLDGESVAINIQPSELELIRDAINEFLNEQGT